MPTNTILYIIVTKLGVCLKSRFESQYWQFPNLNYLSQWCPSWITTTHPVFHIIHQQTHCFCMLLPHISKYLDSILSPLVQFFTTYIRDTSRAFQFSIFFNIEGSRPETPHILALQRCNLTWVMPALFFLIKQHLQFLISPFSSLLAFGEINLPSFYPLVYLWIQISHPILQAIVYEINKVGQ